MGVVVMRTDQMDRMLDHMMRLRRYQHVSRQLVRRLLRNVRGPAITTYRFDGPRATIVAYAARYRSK